MEVTDAEELREGVEDAEGVSERLTDLVAVWVAEELVDIVGEAETLEEAEEV